MGTAAILITLLANTSALRIDRSRSLVSRQDDPETGQDFLNSTKYISSAAQGLSQFATTLGTFTGGVSSGNGSMTIQDIAQLGISIASSVEGVVEDTIKFNSSTPQGDVTTPIASLEATSPSNLEASAQRLAILFANLTYAPQVPLAPITNLSYITDILEKMTPACVDIAQCAAKLIGPAASIAGTSEDRLIDNKALPERLQDLSAAISQAQVSTDAPTDSPNLPGQAGDTAPTVNTTRTALHNISVINQDLIPFFMPEPESPTPFPQPPVVGAVPPVGSPSPTPTTVPPSAVPLPSFTTVTSSSIPPSTSTGTTMATSAPEIAQDMADLVILLIQQAVALGTGAVEVAQNQVALADVFQPSAPAVGNIKAGPVPRGGN